MGSKGSGDPGTGKGLLEDARRNLSKADHGNLGSMARAKEFMLFVIRGAK